MGKSQRDYYEVLGVDRIADADVVKRAFRTRARTLHPDVSTDPAAEEKFSELAEAYDVLSTPRRRLLYDQLGYRGWGRGGFRGATVEEAVARRRRTPVAIVELELDALVAARGGLRRVSFDAIEFCPRCSGGGTAPTVCSTICASCGGTGRSRRRLQTAAGQLLQIESCAKCSGSGLSDAVPCPVCEGLGRSKRKRAANVSVPPGAKTGDRIDPQGSADPVFVVRVLQFPDSPRVRQVAAAGLVLTLAVLILSALLL